ncbi:peptidylprolyl isomerase [Sphingomonas sp. SRS2]|uniref:peptidylprolyl isomerase n=1 Tax=Sphingomonas sp. SRS2 TaxID=133190 RepID=UPI003FA6DF67
MAGVACAQTVPVAAPPADPQNILNLDLSTGGRVKVLLRPDKAPYSVDRIKTLTRRHFYDGLVFHRVIEGFMAQGGDPKGTGEGGSDLPDLKAEFNDLPHVRGVMALARAEGLDSANSQFFIMLQPNLSLDGNYTAIGRVTSGIEYVDALAKGEPPENPSKIIRATIESDDQGIPPAAFVPPPPAAPAPVVTDKKAKKEKKSKQEAVKPAAPTPAPVAEPAAASTAQPEAAPAPQASATDQGTDAAVREVSGEHATDAAVKGIAAEETIAKPQ